MELLSNILVTILVLSFLFKFFIHVYLQQRINETIDGGGPGFFSIKYLLPFTATVESDDYHWKRMCNNLWKVFLLSTILFIVVRILIMIIELT